MAKRVTKGNLWGFIQSRPYASVADIRRLFMMDVEGAASLASNEGAYYIGLPQEAAEVIRQLWQEGRIMLDLNPDVKARVVQGVYPARVPLGRLGARPSNAGNGAPAGPRFRAPAGNGNARPAPPPGVPRLNPAGAPLGELQQGMDAPDGSEGGARRRRRRKRRGPEEGDESLRDGAPRDASPAETAVLATASE